MNNSSMQRRARRVVLSLLLATFALPVPAQIVTTVAGGFVGDNGPSTKASFQAPQAAVLDKHHNAYITDIYTHRIRKVTPTGKITTIAGTGIAGFSGDGGPANLAMVNVPTGMTLDPAGNLVFADSANSRVRKIDSAGIITTIVGSGVYGHSGDGGPATQASLQRPWGVVYDSAGNLYISDTADASVRVVTPQNVISLYAGNYKAGFAGDGGPAFQASLNQPTGLVFDADGCLNISDRSNHRVRKVDTVGIITTIAGNGKAGFSGDGGPATQAAINDPEGLAYQAGVLYIAGNAGRDRVRMVTSDGIINTFAGSTSGYDGDRHAPLASQFSHPESVLPLSATIFVITDRANARVRELAGGVFKTVAGGFLGDGKPATAAALVLPHNITFDTLGNLYIADPGGNRIRKVDTSGKISTVAGNSVSGYTGDGGPATLAELNLPFGLAVDPAGNLFIADNENHVIRKVDTTGIISTLQIKATFYGLEGMTLDASGNLFAADAAACVVWKIAPDLTATTVAGISGSCGYTGDGVPATSAELDDPAGVAVDDLGNIYLADGGNNRIRMIDALGTISTLAGDGTCGFIGDGGPPNLARVCSPEGVAFAGGSLYIADEDNRRVRKVADNVITTIAGTGAAGYNGDNLPALGTNLDDPAGVALDPTGTPYEVDYFQGLVRRIR